MMVQEEFITRVTRSEPHEKELLDCVYEKLLAAESNIAKGQVSDARASLQKLKTKHGLNAAKL